MHIPTSWTIRAMSRSNPVFGNGGSRIFFVPSRSIRFVNRACSFCDCCQRPPAKSTSMRTTSCSPALITVNGIPFGNVIRTGGSIRKFFRVCISGCIVRSIRLDSILQKFFCPFQVLWGINSNSFHFTDTDLYLYPFSSQRSCSKDSANSKEDCGSMVISFSTSVR